MTKQFHVFIDRGCDYAPITGTFATSEEVEAFLLENKEVDQSPEDCWIIFGERFGFRALRTPVGFMLTGPEQET